MPWCPNPLPRQYSLDVFSLLGDKFSHWTVDGQIGIPKSLTKRGYAHTPGAGGCVQNLMHNRVHNLTALISSAWFGICGRIYVKKQSG
jgi:hypothetical protein